MALVRPPHELNPPPPSTDKISTDNSEQLVLLEKPEKERLHQVLPCRREVYVMSAKLALVLILAISYLTFCFVVHYLHVPIRRGVGPPFLHFSTVSVTTTVAILIVYVALWPIKGVINEIRAEEFFRLMDTHSNGVPFDRVNAVSATTTGAFDIFMATIYRHCSPFLTSTLVISLVITAISSIAPAALSAGSIWIDTDNSTMLIGALPKDSFMVHHGYNSSAFDALVTFAPTMAWVEKTFNFSNGYYKVTDSESDQLEYLVPFPPGYTSTTKAQWTTDVILLNPSCSWQAAITTGPGTYDSTWNVTLPESNLSISLGNAFVSSATNVMRYSAFVCDYKNGTEFTVPMDGSLLFVMDQVDYQGPESYDAHKMTVDLSSIPTVGLEQSHTLALLLCSPHISIQTRQVRATGNGNLTLGKHQPSQGNIDFYQANYLLSFALLKLPTNSGPTMSSYQVGTDLMVRLIFGTSVTDLHDNMPPAPLTNITAVYNQLIQSAVKVFLSGAIATENVPGGYPEEQFVFMASLGHVITSAILFAFLAIALVAAQFRKGRVAFTLVNVAAALADSDVPQQSMEMTQFKAGTEERKVLKMVPGGDGRVYCVYESVH